MKKVYICKVGHEDDECNFIELTTKRFCEEPCENPCPLGRAGVAYFKCNNVKSTCPNKVELITKFPGEEHEESEDI